MIVRSIVEKPLEVVATFDYFNDFKDTVNWLAGDPMNNQPIVNHLMTGYAIWLKEHLKKHSQ